MLALIIKKGAKIVLIVYALLALVQRTAVCKMQFAVQLYSNSNTVNVIWNGSS